MRKSLSILALLTTTLVSSTYATADRAQEVMDVTSDANKNGEVYHFTVMTDDQGDITGMAYFEIGHAPKEFPLAQVRQGAVLVHDADHNLDAVVLSTGAFSAKDGGELHMNYLSNGIFHKQPNFFYGMRLQRLGAKWAVYDDKGVFTHMFLKANRALGIIVGIAHVETK